MRGMGVCILFLFFFLFPFFNILGRADAQDGIMYAPNMISYVLPRYGDCDVYTLSLPQQRATNVREKRRALTSD